MLHATPSSVARTRARAVVLIGAVALAIPALSSGASAGVVAPTAGGSVSAPVGRGSAGAAMITTESAGTAAPGTGTVSALVSLTAAPGADAAIARLAGETRTTSVSVRRAALARLAPTPDKGAKVLAWATAHGLHVDATTAWDVTVSGSPATMSAAFDTPLVTTTSSVKGWAGRTFLRPARAPRVPSALVGAASSVVGLDTRPVFSPRATVGLTNAGLTGPPLRDAYGAPRDATAGAGLTVATVQFSGFDSQDLLDYVDQAQIPTFPSQVSLISVGGASVTTKQGNGDVEVLLDTDTILAVAPMARQRTYIGGNNGGGILGVYSQMATDAEHGLFQVASSSWGACESGGPSPTGFESSIQTYVQRVVAAGATFSASSGDSGSDDCGDGSDAVDFPASIPAMVAVGGTKVSNGYQTGWMNSPSPGASSGGGVSNLYPKPSYQSSITGDGSNSRQVPDLALDADPSSGLAITHSGSYMRVGGTSLASPLFAGLLAGALSAADRTTGLGDIHSALYAAPSSAFQDVLTGSNGSFTARPGYDNVTGLGAPRMGALATALGIAPVARATYHPIDPARIVDTRSGLGAPQAKLAAGGRLTVQVAGATSDLPSSGLTAVVLNVTATNTTKSGYLSVFPTGAVGGTTTSAVNVLPGGPPVPNLVTVKADSQGRVTVYSNSGGLDVVVDVEGYYTRSSGDGYVSLAPARVLDTRNGTGAPKAKVSPAGPVDLQVTGVGGVPSGVDAVALNVTAVNATLTTFVSVYPTGFAGGPATSNLNVPRGSAVPNLVISKVSADGKVTLYNGAGTVDLVADVEGYFAAGAGQAFSPIAPVRMVDTRAGNPITAGTTVNPWLLASDSRVTGADLNVTGVNGPTATFVSVFPCTVSQAVGATSSSLNLDPREVRANQVMVSMSPTGCAQPPYARVYDNGGYVDVLIDVGGVFSSEPVLLPATTTTLTGPSVGTTGTPVTLSATPSRGGSVVFVDSTTGLLATRSATANNAVTFSTTLTAGTHTLYAMLVAADGLQGSTSAPLTIVVS